MGAILRGGEGPSSLRFENWGPAFWEPLSLGQTGLAWDGGVILRESAPFAPWGRRFRLLPRLDPAPHPQGPAAQYVPRAGVGWRTEQAVALMPVLF